MREIGLADYRRFIAGKAWVEVGGSKIRLLGRQRPATLQPEDFKLETTTVWSFPKRGKWATHRSGYRGNWAPQIARNIILRYSQPGDTVLDQMVGGGTTLVECKLTGRNGIGVDVNRDALMLCTDALNFSLVPEPRQVELKLAERRAGYAVGGRRGPGRKEPHPQSLSTIVEREEVVEPTIKLYHGDARNLDALADESIDLVATHPPYANIIRYTARKGRTSPLTLPSLARGEEEAGQATPEQAGDVANPHDLSNVRDIGEYVVQMRLVAQEAYRVLKPGKFCAILMGDTRRNKHYVTIAFRVMQAFLEAGFILKEDIIKAQWNTATEGLWANLSREKNFLLIMHEHLFIFRKPAVGERRAHLRKVCSGGKGHRLFTLTRRRDAAAVSNVFRAA
jgi:DNA modification methylase